MADLKKLAEHRKDILLAEVAAWLHNIGKLDPNFPKGTLDRVFRIKSYRFKRFVSPSEEISSSFPKAQQKLEEFRRSQGPLYFPLIPCKRWIQQRELPDSIQEYVQREIDKHIAEWKKSYPTNWRDLEKRKREDLKKKRIEEIEAERESVKRRELDRAKQREQKWESLELGIPPLNISWSLGSLLTLFWDPFFDKPEKEDYEPGSDEDPDYRREYLLKGLDETLPALLILSHGEISGQEKKGLTVDGVYRERKQREGSSEPQRPENDSEYPVWQLRLSTAFGFEPPEPLPWRTWQAKRLRIVNLIPQVWQNPVEQRKRLEAVLDVLKGGISDARLPFNEISLFDYSASIAALFKASIAQAILLGTIPTPATMRWRFLAVRMDAMDFLFHVQNVADLVARKRLLDTSYRLIEHLFAVEFPIGSPVYQDENGIVFVIPELPGYEDIKLKKEFESLVYKALKEPNALETLTETIFLYGAEDIQPIVQITPPRRGKKLNLVEALSTPSTNAPDPRKVKSWWTDRTEEKCSVCGLRPEGYVEPGLPPFVTEQKARERHLCGVCLARRGRRSEEWATQEPDSTIWVGEVADINARIALIVGRFALDDWLSGKLVRSMTIGTDEFGNWLAKPPTFARIHRIWRTTFEFWQESLAQIRDSLTDDRRRLRLYLDSPPDLGAYHVYELDLGVTSVSVVWVPPNEKQQGYLLSVENLGYIAKQLGKKKDIYQYPDIAAISVEEHIQKQLPWDAVLRNPEAHAEARSKNLMKGHKIINVDYQDVSYATIIPILAEPRTFMALVPADKAVDVVQAIRTKYEREMGKVRNRLPLHLGIVFADAHTPLRAILDAGRRMLAQQSDAVGWQVKDVRNKQIKNSDALPERFGKDSAGQFAEWYEVDLAKGERKLTWYVPAVMGDGSTEDQWYPYVFWERDKDGNTDPGSATVPRTRYYQAPNPFNPDADDKPQLGWLVHAVDLKEGDIVYFTPATLDFQWLDSSASRFEIAYDGENGRRRGSLHRPYLLDELDDLRECWQLLAGEKRLTNTQIHQVRDLIEAKRREWFPENPRASLQDDTFREFCRNVLKNAEWGERSLRLEDDINSLTNWAVSGVLVDAVELFAQILKRKAPEEGEA